MKTKNISLLAALSLAGLLSSAHAASYTEAQFTRLENEVKVLKENSAPHSAAVGENVAAVTSVATGANSRAELRFPDKSLTRLGANSRFTIRGEERTLDLDKGVMMLQVPKQMGGAKVRTAAVTAAVTGTTVMFEYLPLPAGHIMPKPNGPDMPSPDGHSYIKLIVIEGTVDFYSNKHRSHFQTVHAGQMIIMDPHSTNIPPPVDVDLRRLLRTSRLLSQFENLPNTAFVNQAVQAQLAELKNGTLQETNLVIPGLGTFVAFTGNTIVGANNGLIFPGIVPEKPIPGQPAPPPPPNNGPSPVPTRIGPPPVPPHLQGFLPLIAGTTVLNGNSSITTDPQVTAFNSGKNGLLTSSGAIYHGQDTDGPLNLFAFGSTAPPSRVFQNFLNDNSGTWSAFKFDSLLINGAPNLTTNQVNDLLLVANGNITLSDDSTSFPTAGGGGGGSGNVIWSLPDGVEAEAVSHEVISGDSTALINDLALYSHKGTINFSQFSLFGDFQNIALNAAGVKSNVNFNNNSEVDTGGSVLVTAGQNVNVQGSNVSGSSVHIVANQNVNVSDEGSLFAKSGNLVVRALNGVQISDSSTLKQFSDEGGMNIFRIQAKSGPIVVTQSSTLTGNRVTIQAANGGGTALGGVAPGNIQISSSSVSSGNGLGVRSLAPGGTLTFASDTLTASRGIRLYAAGNGGTVIFTQNTTLNGNFLTLAGTTVEVASGVTVTVNNSNVRIFTDNALYNTTGYGTIQYGSAPVGQTSAFAKRPKFRGPPPLAGSKPPGLRPPKPGTFGKAPPVPPSPSLVPVTSSAVVSPSVTVPPPGPTPKGT